MKKILILGANPKNTSSLRLDEEVREIKNALQLSSNRDDFHLLTESAVRVDDLTRFLLHHQPTIVHFGGHGSGTDGLILEDNSGHTQPVSTQALAKLFRSFEHIVECVLLNACYSEVQATEIHQHIDCVIGMNKAIGDKAAIKFSVGFYTALWSGRSYEDCFDIGCTSIDLQGIPEYLTPKIKIRRRRYQAVVKENTESLVSSESTGKEKSSSQLKYGGISQSISGSTMYGGMQAVQGENNQQTMNTNVASASEKQLTQSEVVALLAQMEQLVEEFPQIPATIKQKSLRYLLAASEEAQDKEPDKQLAASNLKRMAEILKNTSETVVATKTLWENLKPILVQLSTWLGVAHNFFIF